MNLKIIPYTLKKNNIRMFINLYLSKTILLVRNKAIQIFKVKRKTKLRKIEKCYKRYWMLVLVGTCHYSSN